MSIASIIVARMLLNSKADWFADRCRDRTAFLLERKQGERCGELAVFRHAFRFRPTG